MKFSEKQLEQCRKEFEVLAKSRLLSLATYDGSYEDEDTFYFWEGFCYAWRPIPSAEEIEKLVDQGIEDFYASPITVFCSRPFIAQAIHRAFGGEE